MIVTPVVKRNGFSNTTLQRRFRRLQKEPSSPTGGSSRSFSSVNESRDIMTVPVSTKSSSVAFIVSTAKVAPERLTLVMMRKNP